jgi:hypothetical protein
MSDHRFGRKVPSDFAHVDLYPAAKLALAAPPLVVNRTLPFTREMKAAYFQGNYNGCVGASLSQMQAFNNAIAGRAVLRYDWRALWNAAKAIDEFPDTQPGDNEGTSLRAGFDVLRQNGLIRLNANGKRPKKADWNPAEGIESNYWATSVDQMRSIISQGVPLAMATDFTRAMENPVLKDGHYRMPETTDFRDVVGGHCWIIVGALDDRECFQMPNTWNLGWPDPTGKELFADVPYKLIERLLPHGGECGVAIDRKTAALLGLAPMKED